MRRLLNRNLVVPMLMVMGLLIMIGGDIDTGGWMYAIAIGYWIIAGWIESVRARRNAARPAAPITAQVTATSSRMRRSDGARGAFSRLDPAWREWMVRQSDAPPEKRP